MHIGLNLVYLTPEHTGGTEVYARALLPQLVAAAPQHRFTAFVNQDAAGSPGPWTETMEQVVVPVRALNRLQWVRGEQQLLPGLARRAGVDLLHSLANTGPVHGRFRRVLTVHDLIYHLVPQARGGLRARGMRILLPMAARRSDRIIAISQTTATDLQRQLGLTASVISVVPSGVGSPRATPVAEGSLRTQLDAGERPIVLTVSAKLPHKNLPRLIAAIASLPAATRPLLVIPGYPTRHEDELRALATAHGVTGDVRFLGWVSAEQLEGLYAAAALVVLPSLYEGFGLPVLEAMARAVPVACSGRGALAEVAGDAALTFDPESEAAIAQAITTLLADPARADALRRLGPERARAFSWAATATATVTAYAAAGCP